MSIYGGVRLNCSTEEAQRYQLLRKANDPNLSLYVLPGLSDDPAEVYARLLEAERLLIPESTDYKIGSATRDNEILEIAGTNRVILSAEHATKHMRGGKEKTVDFGTGALGKVVAIDTQSDALIAIGRQTGDANNDKEHPFKEALAKIIKKPTSQAHLSIHGIQTALTINPRADRGFSVMLGIGDKPSDATKALVDLMLEAGREHDLRVGVNQRFLKFDSKNQPILNDDGTVKVNAFKAPYNEERYTTVGFSRTLAEDLDRLSSFAAVEVELSDILRCRRKPVKSEGYPTQRDRELGAYLGYHFIKVAVDSVDKL